MGVMKGPNFADKNRKSRLEVTLEINQEETVIGVYTPTKAMFDTVEAMAALIDGKEEFEVSEWYPEIAKILSNNRERIPVTEADLEEMGFDLEDVADFIASYLFFLSELANLKN